ncbi:HlyC/CorC family transporter [Candidatus Ichthyocystis hellenicum]|uniref:HlyC/CorC family transporter n=1 Tax=Candidatus Ichthyocystis hellenicum TaxID=1561003 RepID=UPI000AE21472|nr:transporter associated domain-containing protein [Candidatus Ichthyocystis hellenicum]
MTESDGSSRLSGWRPRLLWFCVACLARSFQTKVARYFMVRVVRFFSNNNIIGPDDALFVERALHVSDMTVTDILVPRTQMQVVDISWTNQQILSVILDTGHSRFPVVDGKRDTVVGIFLAKDFIRSLSEDGFDLHEHVRPVVFVPESKPLNLLLRDFRMKRYHMAIVVDEYGGVSGLVTIEDVLEMIVGDIEDEFDFDEPGDDIVCDEDGSWRVKASVEIAALNEAIGSDFLDDSFDTVGGLVLHHSGKVLQRGELIFVDGWKFSVIQADARRLHSLRVERVPPNSS